MCNYFSGILTEKGEVLWLKENPVNHEAIVAAHNLKDTELKNRNWVRFEITPKNIDALLQVKTRKELNEKLRELFVFRWDEERSLPDWVEKNVAKLIVFCWAALEESVKIHLLLGEEFIQELKDKGYVHMMWGTSQVGVMRGTSQVGEMWETSKVGVMRETSKVGEMRETSQVGVMRGTSKVGEMWGTSQVGEINDFACAVKFSVLYVAKAVTVKKKGKVPAEE